MRLIDADALEAKLEEQRKLYIEMDMKGAEDLLVHDVLHHVWEAPTIDAVPVRYGQWIEDKIQIHVEKTYHCSECDCLAWGEDEKTRYCPTCGARMDDDKWEE